METRAHYAAVGAFVLVVVLAAFVTVMWLGRVELRQHPEAYYIFFKGSVAGLGRGAAVQYNGIPVGRVSDIRVDKDNIGQIQVTVMIDRNLVEIKTDARAYLDTNILSGVSTIQIRGGTQQAEVLQPRPGHNHAVIKVGQTELEAVKASLPELIGDLRQTSHHLNQLLDDKNREAVADSLQNIRTATAAFANRGQEVGVLLDNTNAAVAEVASLLRHVDQSYSARGGLKDQVSQTLKDYRGVAARLNDTARQLNLTVAEIRPGLRDFTQTTLPDVDALIGNAQLLAGNLNRFVLQLQRDPTRLLFGDRREGYRPR